MKKKAWVVLCVSCGVVMGCAGQTQSPQAATEISGQVSGAAEHLEPPVCNIDEKLVEGRCVKHSSVACGKLEISAETACERTGAGERLVLRGDILTPESVIEGGSVVIEKGRIVYVGCDPDMTDASVVTCPDSVISPGFINGHEHLSYSNNRPAVWADERYMHRHEWRKGLNGHTKLNGPGTKHNEVVEIRSLMSGTTSIFGSGKVDGLARNIDVDTIDGVKSVYQTFPLGDTDGTMKTDNCDYLYHGTVVDMPDCPFGPHLGEGISEAAVNELKCLSGAGPYNLFTEDLVVIHGMAATPEYIEKMARNDVKLVWSPRSNISLYGDTAQVPVFDRLGVHIGLGTDWIYSGSATMLRELTCADEINKNYYQNYFSDEDLWQMATWNNAVAFGLDKTLGAIGVGYLADLVVYRKKDGVSPYRSIIEANNSDILLVTLEGKLIYGDAHLISSGEDIDVCGVAKKIDLGSAGAKMTYAEAASHAAYPMFFCDIPEDEPSCVPARVRPEDTMTSTRYAGAGSAEDRDGDGIPDVSDNCPDMFNPIRPSETVQGDGDGDGLGDICDAYPLCAANNQACPMVVKTDYDGDDIENAHDNCPRVSNADQKDRDGDGHGDVCDACPADANPGDARCPMTKTVSIAEVNRKITEACPNLEASCKVNEEVLVLGRVTSVTRDGFFMQTPVADDRHWTGIYVESGTAVKEGDDVWVQAWPMRNTGMPSLKHALVTIQSSGNQSVAPIHLTAADITTGGPSAQAFTGVLVRVGPAVVLESDRNAAYHMYPVADPHDGKIYIDDFVWRIAQPLKQGQIFKSIDGILVYDFGNHKIAPRRTEDLISE
ncbi:MAG: amidohydrolase family protein [Proteobacteria bacterium]|nr:amidohydrolase family protein [Pseudomonadota bacterium]